MAYPFLTPKPIIGRPISGGVSMAMTTDPAHATACAIRLRLYTNSGRTVATGSGGDAQSSGGSVQERLVCAITDLPADTLVYPKMEYEEVAGSGTWVEIAAVTAMPGLYSPPAASGTAHIVFSADDHMTAAILADTNHERYIRAQNAATAVAAQKFHLHVNLGDKNLGPLNLQFATQADADAWALAYLACNAAAIERGPLAIVNGNHEEIDGSGTGMDALMQSVHDDFFLNPVGEDATGNRWKIAIGPVLLLGIEGYTQCGFSDFTDPASSDVPTPEDWDIPADTKTMIATELAATTLPFAMLNMHQTWGGAWAYGSAGGTKIDRVGTYMHTLLGVVQNALATNASLKAVIILMGHDHAAHHATVGSIHVVQVPSATNHFGRITEANGYRNASGGPAENVSLAQNFDGIVRVTATPTLCTLQFVRTTEADGSTACDRVMHTVQVSADSRVALRPQRMRKGRAA